MKYLLSYLMLISFCFLGAIQVTINNNNLALVNEYLPMDLKEDVVDFNFYQIPLYTWDNTVGFAVKDNYINMITPNLKYVLATTDEILQKYIQKQIKKHHQNNSISFTNTKPVKGQITAIALKHKAGRKK